MRTSDLIRPTPREIERNIREWREQCEPYNRQLVKLYGLAMPSWLLHKDGTIEHGVATEVLSPELVEMVRWLHDVIHEMAVERGLIQPTEDEA